MSSINNSSRQRYNNYKMTELSFTEATKVLGLDANYSKEELKKKYRTLAKKHHPDHGGDVEKFKLIQQAFNKLSTMKTTDRTARVIEDQIFDDLFMSVMNDNGDEFINWMKKVMEYDE